MIVKTRDNRPIADRFNDCYHVATTDSVCYTDRSTVAAKGQNIGPCWIFTRALSVDRKGYGRLKGTINGKCHRLAHTIAYALLVGPIPTSLQIDHLCHERRCVNPHHLEPVTNAENARRGDSLKGTRTHCKAGHERTPANTYTRARGTSQCRVCANDQTRARARRATKKEGK
jgi:hypothetical protein